MAKFVVGQKGVGVVKKFLHPQAFGFLEVEGYEDDLYFHISAWSNRPAEGDSRGRNSSPDET